MDVAAGLTRLPLDPARFVASDALGRDGWSELGVELGTHWERRPITLVRY